MDTQTNNEREHANDPVSDATDFINSQMSGESATSFAELSRKLMSGQAMGMMAQDLQSFLKGFEQVGLVTISRLANNLLTYGTASHDPSGQAKASAGSGEERNMGDTVRDMREMFNIIIEYAEAKARIISAVQPSEKPEFDESPNTAAYMPD